MTIDNLLFVTLVCASRIHRSQNSGEYMSFQLSLELCRILSISLCISLKFVSFRSSSGTTAPFLSSCARIIFGFWWCG